MLVLVLDGGFVRLGMWQLGVAEHRSAPLVGGSSRAAVAEPVERVLTPHTPFPSNASNRPVTMTGTYAASGQVLVTGRRLDGVAGLWVVAPLRVSASGATIAVLRGFVRSAADEPPVPAGVLDVAGTLAPGESPPTSSAPLPPGRLASLDLSVLVNAWPNPMYNAFVFATAETSGGVAVALPTTLRRVPPPTGARPLEWRNATYALQWWFFAAFALWMWWKMVRDASQGEWRARQTREDSPR